MSYTKLTLALGVACLAATISFTADVAKDAKAPEAKPAAEAKADGKAAPADGKTVAAKNDPAEVKEVKTMQLPKPETTGGMPLMLALSKRQSAREYGAEKLSDQTMSNLLWAANGVNRADAKKRTAPTAMNWQEIDVYVLTADGAFLYDAAAHALKQVSAEDLRETSGMQDFVKTAPLNLVFVADYAKITGNTPVPEDRKAILSASDAAFVSQNVYLFCASEGLNTVVRAMIPADKLAPKLGLRPEQKIVLAQSVGYPKK